MTLFLCSCYLPEQDFIKPNTTVLKLSTVNYVKKMTSSRWCLSHYFLVVSCFSLNETILLNFAVRKLFRKYLTRGSRFIENHILPYILTYNVDYSTSHLHCSLLTYSFNSSFTTQPSYRLAYHQVYITSLFKTCLCSLCFLGTFPFNSLIRLLNDLLTFQSSYILVQPQVHFWLAHTIFFYQQLCVVIFFLVLRDHGVYMYVV